MRFFVVPILLANEGVFGIALSRILLLGFWTSCFSFAMFCLIGSYIFGHATLFNRINRPTILQNFQ